VVGVEDHKTTSDFRYCKTPEVLATDIQMNIYAYWVFRFPHLATLLPVPPSASYRDWLGMYAEGVDLVKLSHTYMRTRGVPEARRVEKLVDWSSVAREWAHIEQDVRDMEAVAATVPAGFEDIPNDQVRQEAIADWLVRNVEGEPSRCRQYGGCQFCNRCPEAITGSKGTDNLEMAKVFANIGGNMSTSTTVEDLTKRLQERMKAAPTPPPTTLQAPTPVTGVVPPDAPSRVNDQGDPPEAALEAPAPAPKKRGRPAKAPEAPGAATTPPDPVPHNGGQHTQPQSQFQPGGAIFVNCRPVTGMGEVDNMAWERWIAAQLEALHTDLKVLDYRLVDFGKGAGARDAWLRKYLHTAPPVCVVQTSHPEAGPFLAIALPKAQLVVR
jgi:hypothetical protein